ncbi:citrate/2-methylcitrate synthase, partial [Corynebacterium striatum]
KNETRGPYSGAPAPVPTTRNPAVPGLRNTGTQNPHLTPAYHILGFDIEFFTPIFVMARITGWTAHIVEQNENNSLIRPLSAYNGKEQRSVPPKQI